MSEQEGFKHIGSDVVIFDTAKIVHKEVVSIGDKTHIDDFAFINGGKGVTLGKANHVCSFVSIIGCGELITEDYVGMAAGCRIMTASHDYRNGYRMTSCVPEDQQEILTGKIVLEKDVFLGSNVIVYPNVTIGEGAVICAGSFVYHDVKPWTVNMGVPARVIGTRPKVKFE